MAQPTLPRELVHELATDIADHKAEHRLSIQNLVRRQRNLAKALKRDVAPLGTRPSNLVLYTMGALARLFEQAGGTVRAADAATIQAARERVQAAAPALFPADEGFAGRLRAVQRRAQPHLLDELVADLFTSEETRESYEPIVLAQMFLLCWVAVEVLDACWEPPAGLYGVTYVHTPMRNDEA